MMNRRTHHRHQTARTLPKALGKEDKISVWGELVLECNRSKLYNRLHQYTKESTILMIGHEPYPSNIMYDMIFQTNRVNQLDRINLKKDRLAKIRVISDSEYEW